MKTKMFDLAVEETERAFFSADAEVNIKIEFEYEDAEGHLYKEAIIGYTPPMLTIPSGTVGTTTP